MIIKIIFSFAVRKNVTLILTLYKTDQVTMRAIDTSEKDRKEIYEMASLGMRYADIAVIKDVSLSTLKRKYKKELGQGRRIGIKGLLRTAYYMANEMKNPTMMCFLLKTQGGLREKNTVNMTVDDKRPKEQIKREKLPDDPVLSAKMYREIITK